MITQVYEIQTPREAELMIDLGVDHIGSVLVPESGLKQPALRDAVTEVKSGERISSLIPLCVDLDAVLLAIDYYRPDIIHFCENIDHSEAAATRAFELQSSVRRRCPDVRLMRSLPIAPAVGSSGDRTLELAKRFEPISDLFLTDTLIVLSGSASHQVQPVDGFVGITGETCDWDMAASLVSRTTLPVILAGGLSPENVKAAIESVQPAGVDSCTRTNALDRNGHPIRFQKDTERVRRFVEAANAAAH